MQNFTSDGSPPILITIKAVLSSATPYLRRDWDICTIDIQ
jgi:hypothetical protein